MTEDEARQVELLRAVEVEDRECMLLTSEDRAQADAHARAASAALNGQRAADAFIARRGEFASARLATRHPGIAGLLRRSRWPNWLGVVLPLLALVAGVVASEFGTGRRLDLLAVPLLGTVAWNLLAYPWLIVGSFNRKKPHLDPLYRIIARLTGFGQRDLDRETPLHRAALAFESRWARASAPLVAARIARTLHLGAAALAGAQTAPFC